MRILKKIFFFFFFDLSEIAVSGYKLRIYEHLVFMSINTNYSFIFILYPLYKESHHDTCFIVCSLHYPLPIYRSTQQSTTTDASRISTTAETNVNQAVCLPTKYNNYTVGTFRYHLVTPITLSCTPAPHHSNVR